MTNAPTNSAMPPNTSSAVRKKPNSSSRSAACAAASSLAGADLHVLAREREAHAAAQLRRRDALGAATEIASSLPRRPASACAAGSVAIATG